MIFDLFCKRLPGIKKPEEKNNSLNEESSKNDTGEIVNINKNLNTSVKHNKNQQEEKNKIKKFKFFTPGFLK